MARYVLLRIDDDEQADNLLRDLALYPSSVLRTPTKEPVHAEVVPDLDEADIRGRRVGVQATPEDRARGLRAVLRQSYLRAGKLADEWEASA